MLLYVASVSAAKAVKNACMGGTPLNSLVIIFA
jgi:hypothetical protein